MKIGVSEINLCGEFITHKLFGRGQIMENKNGVVTVLFCETKNIKKFIYPGSIEKFLMLENPVTAKQYKQYTDKIADEKAAARKIAAERLALKKLAAKKHVKTVKKTQKKPVKKAVEDDADHERDDR